MFTCVGFQRHLLDLYEQLSFLSGKSLKITKLISLITTSMGFDGKFMQKAHLTPSIRVTENKGIQVSGFVKERHYGSRTLFYSVVLEFADLIILQMAPLTYFLCQNYFLRINASPVS